MNVDCIICIYIYISPLYSIRYFITGVLGRHVFTDSFGRTFWGDLRNDRDLLFKNYTWGKLIFLGAKFTCQVDLLERSWVLVF